MRTRDFCRFIEAAMMEAYGEDVQFDTVPYSHEGSKPANCLGFFLTEDAHMAVVSTRAMYLVYQDNDNLYPTGADRDEALGDFADLMSGMHVAPYMQWTCCYFPGLTAEQVLAETAEDPEIRDVGDGSHGPTIDGVDRVPDRLVADLVVKDLDSMHDIDAITADQCLMAKTYVTKHVSDVAQYRLNGMKVSEIADTILSLVHIATDHESAGGGL